MSDELAFDFMRLAWERDFLAEVNREHQRVNESLRNELTMLRQLVSL